MSTKSSINQTELAKFNKVTSQWWKEDGEFKILHQINPIRLHYIVDKMKYHFNISDETTSFAKLNILDVGCGGGLIASHLARLGCHVTGIDALQGNIDTAMTEAEKQKLNINYFQSTVEELTQPNSQQYDMVLCLEVIEHVNNSDYFISNLANLVKPNGMVIISTINRTIKAYMLAILMAEYVLKWIPEKTHDHNKFIKPSEIHAMFKKHQIELKELKGLTYNILNKRWYLSNDIDVNYFAYLTKMSTQSFIEPKSKKDRAK